MGPSIERFALLRSVTAPRTKLSLLFSKLVIRPKSHVCRGCFSLQALTRSSTLVKGYQTRKSLYSVILAIYFHGFPNIQLDRRELSIVSRNAFLYQKHFPRYLKNTLAECTLVQF